MDHAFQIPMLILGIIWIFLLILELLKKSNPLFEKLSIAIWIIFILDFFIKFIIAPSKKKFIKYNILTILSLFVPAVRIFVVFRLVKLFNLTRGIIVLKLVSGMNRGMNTLAHTFEKRAFGFLAFLTVIVWLVSAAGMYEFEKKSDPGIPDYTNAVWVTAMFMSTVGADTWPKTMEGKFLCLFLSVYGFTVFGYVTATFASSFFEEDNTPKDKAQFEELKKEIQELKDLIKGSNKNG